MDGRRCSSAGQIIFPNHFPTKIKGGTLPPFLMQKNKPQPESTEAVFVMDEKRKTANHLVCGLDVSDMIRTRDLLIRSQTLYPAELHSHIRFEQNL